MKLTAAQTKEVAASAALLAIVGGYLAGGKFPSLTTSYGTFCAAVAAWLFTVTGGSILGGKVAPKPEAKP